MRELIESIRHPEVILEMKEPAKSNFDSDGILSSVTKEIALNKEWIKFYSWVKSLKTPVYTDHDNLIRKCNAAITALTKVKKAIEDYESAIGV